MGYSDLLSVTVCVCCVHAVKGNRFKLSTPNMVHIILCGSVSAFIDLEVKRSKVKVTRLRKPSQLHVCCGHYATAATMGLHII